MCFFGLQDPTIEQALGLDLLTRGERDLGEAEKEGRRQANHGRNQEGRSEGKTVRMLLWKVARVEDWLCTLIREIAIPSFSSCSDTA